jgi:hypothetical protein
MANDRSNFFFNVYALENILVALTREIGDGPCFLYIKFSWIGVHYYQMSTKIHPKCPREFTQKMSTKIHPKRGLLVDKSVHEKSPKVSTRSHPFCPRDICHPQFMGDQMSGDRMSSGPNEKQPPFSLSRLGLGNVSSNLSLLFSI